MKGPGDGARLLLTALLAAWVMAYAYSVLSFEELWNGAGQLALDPADHSAAQFLGWQGVAGVLGVAIFGVSRLWPRGAAARQIGALPLLLAALLVAALGLLTFLSRSAV